MTDYKKLAEDLLALGAYQTLVKAEYERRHKELEELYERDGLRGQDIMLPNGEKFGGVGMNRDRKYSVSVNNHDAMVEWLEANHPTEVVSKTTYDINGAYWRALVIVAEEAGIGVDPDTGEILTWMTVEKPRATLRANSTALAKSMVKQLVEDGSYRLELTRGSRDESTEGEDR